MLEQNFTFQSEEQRRQHRREYNRTYQREYRRRKREHVENVQSEEKHVHSDEANRQNYSRRRA